MGSAQISTNIDRSLLVDINRLKSPKVKKEFKQITCDYITWNCLFAVFSKLVAPYMGITWSCSLINISKTLTLTHTKLQDYVSSNVVKKYLDLHWTWRVILFSCRPSDRKDTYFTVRLTHLPSPVVVIVPFIAHVLVCVITQEHYLWVALLWTCEVSDTNWNNSVYAIKKVNIEGNWIWCSYIETLNSFLDLKRAFPLCCI